MRDLFDPEPESLPRATAQAVRRPVLLMFGNPMPESWTRAAFDASTIEDCSTARCPECGWRAHSYGAPLPGQVAPRPGTWDTRIRESWRCTRCCWTTTAE